MTHKSAQNRSISLEDYLSNEYILAAKAVGASSGRIIRTHIIPNCISVIIITTALQIPSAIFTESFLSFIGMGVQAPMPSLGSLVSTARQGLQSYPFQLVFPAVTIVLIVLAFNLNTHLYQLKNLFYLA